MSPVDTGHGVVGFAIQNIMTSIRNKVVPTKMLNVQCMKFLLLTFTINTVHNVIQAIIEPYQA
jgi:hypothetical protein